MTCFKIIQDNKVVNVGCTFLRWNENRHRLYVCDVDDGQFVQSHDELVYRDKWLMPAPKEAGQHEEATIKIISRQEYEDLLAILDEGEEIVEEQIVEPQPEIEKPLVEEKPMSIAEMRDTITRQQEQINILMAKLSGRE